MAKTKSGKTAAPPSASSDKVKNGRVAKPVEAIKAVAKDVKNKVASVLPAVNGSSKKSSKAAKPSKKVESESESDDDDEESSADDSEEDGDDSESEDSELEPAKQLVKPTTNGAAKAAPAESDDDSEDSDDSDEGVAVAKAPQTAAGAAEAESSDDDEDDSSSDDDEEVATKAAPAAAGKRKADTADEPAAKKAKTTEATEATNLPNLFVGNLSWNVDEDWLSREFSEFGELLGCRIVTDRESGRSKGFGYVEFANAADAAKALEAKKGFELDGRELNVDFATPRGGDGAAPRGDRVNNRASKFGDSESTPSDTLFVGNISFSATAEIMQEMFGEYGSITRVSLPTDPDSGALKGFGYVGFSSVDEAKAALEALNGADVAGRAVRLDFATARVDRDGGGGRGGGFRGGRGGGDRGGRGGGFRGGRGGDRGGRGGGRGGGFRGGRGDRGGGGFRGGRGGSTNRGGLGDFSGKKMTF